MVACGRQRSGFIRRLICSARVRRRLGSGGEGGRGAAAAPTLRAGSAIARPVGVGERQHTIRNETTLGAMREIDRLAAAALREAARRKRRSVGRDDLARVIEAESREAA